MTWMMTLMACAMLSRTPSNAENTVNPINTTNTVNPMNPIAQWTPERSAQIQRAVSVALEKSPSSTPFAVFDADNTIWKHDIEEGLLAYMSAKGLIVLNDTLPEHLRPIPVQPDETPFSYYERLCEIDHSLGYLWAAQIFSGHTLGALRGYVADLMALKGTVDAPMPNGESKSVPVPKLFPAQIELIHWLQEQGVDVWVVSASLEEVVRMVVSDPAYGLALPPEKVIGVNLMLKSPSGDSTVGAIERGEGHVGIDYYFSEERMSWTLGDYPFAPMTWYAGKVAAIKEWIDPSQRPILVAGDSPNDFYMQFYSDVEHEGVRLRIHRKDSHKQKLTAEQERRATGTADDAPTKGWIEVTAAELGVAD